MRKYISTRGKPRKRSGPIADRTKIWGKSRTKADMTFREVLLESLGDIVNGSRISNYAVPISKQPTNRIAEPYGFYVGGVYRMWVTLHFKPNSLNVSIRWMTRVRNGGNRQNAAEYKLPYEDRTIRDLVKLLTGIPKYVLRGQYYS